MVLIKSDRTYDKQWNSVPKPVAKSDNAALGNFNGAPLVPPKPTGLIYVYVSPDKTGSYSSMTQKGSEAFPQNSQFIYNGFQGYQPEYLPSASSIQYPCTDECLDTNPRIRIKNRAKQSGKGYNVLADMKTKRSKTNSKGGKMFLKQKERMEQHTSENEANDGFYNYLPNSKIDPREERSTSSDKVKKLPNALSKSSAEKRKRMGMALPRLRSPPPEWKAKVDSGYTLDDDHRGLWTKRWNTADATRRSAYRSKSVPPPSQTEQEEQCFMDPDSRPTSGSRITMINFDAKMHKGAYHQKQEPSEGRILSRPYVEHDFNAKPVGWNRGYAQQY